MQNTTGLSGVRRAIFEQYLRKILPDTTGAVETIPRDLTDQASAILQRLALTGPEIFSHSLFELFVVNRI